MSSPYHAAGAYGARRLGNACLSIGDLTGCLAYTHKMGWPHSQLGFKISPFGNKFFVEIDHEDRLISRLL